MPHIHLHDKLDPSLEAQQFDFSTVHHPWQLGNGGHGYGSASWYWPTKTRCTSRSEWDSLHLAKAASPGDFSTPFSPRSATTPAALLIAARHEEALGRKMHRQKELFVSLTEQRCTCKHMDCTMFGTQALETLASSQSAHPFFPEAWRNAG